MGALRDTLKVLFNEQSADEVIRQMLARYRVGQSMPTTDITSDSYNPMYLHASPTFTKNQAEAAFGMASSVWMQGDECSSLRYASGKNVFNVPLHFASEVLISRSESPVCRFDCLLKWQEISYLLGEDLFTTAFLASSDAVYGRQRSFFSWPAIIDHDNSALRNLYGKRMADIHNHLKGTGFAPELSWLSLMNDVSERYKRFNSKEFKSSKYPRAWYSTSSGQTCSLYTNVIKAAAIRLFLFLYSVQDICTDRLLDINKLLDILRVKSDTAIFGYLAEIISCINTVKLMYARH